MVWPVPSLSTSEIRSRRRPISRVISTSTSRRRWNAPRSVIGGHGSNHRRVRRLRVRLVIHAGILPFPNPVPSGSRIKAHAAREPDGDLGARGDGVPLEEHLVLRSNLYPAPYGHLGAQDVANAERAQLTEGHSHPSQLGDELNLGLAQGRCHPGSTWRLPALVPRPRHCVIPDEQDRRAGRTAVTGAERFRDGGLSAAARRP